jgi:TRAP-type C4-dicarboxylate transport system substrate-binding protein
MRKELTPEDQAIILEAMKTTCKLWIKLNKSDKATINLLLYTGYSVPDAHSMLEISKKYYQAFGKIEFKELEAAA